MNKPSRHNETQFLKLCLVFGWTITFVLAWVYPAAAFVAGYFLIYCTVAYFGTVNTYQQSGKWRL